MVNQPLITVITVVYNDVNSIGNTIKSVLQQSFKMLEYIVIDGSSTDGTIDEINVWSEHLILISEKDKGIYDAMNKGINAASGQWIIFMNSGDTFSSNDVLQNLSSVLHTDSSLDVIYGDTLLVDERQNKKKLQRAYKFNYVKWGMPFCHQSVLVKTNLLKLKHFDIQYKVAADYKFFLNLYLEKKYKIKQVNFPISIFNTNGVSMSINTFLEMMKIVIIEISRLGYFVVLFHFSRLIKFYCSRFIKRILFN